MEATKHLQIDIDREKLQIILTRAFDAPRALVWRALTEPALLTRWWGGEGTTEVAALDLRPGGAWRFIDHAANGTHDAFHGVFREIDPPSRIVQTFEYEPWAGHVIVETLILTERDGRTTLTAVEQFDTLEDLEGMYQSGMETGAGASYDRLEALLRVTSDDPSEFVARSS